MINDINNNSIAIAGYPPNHLQLCCGRQDALAHAVEHGGGRRRGGEELLEEVVAARLEDDLVVDIGDVHDLRGRQGGIKQY